MVHEHGRIIYGMGEDPSYSGFARKSANKLFREIHERLKEELEEKHGKDWHQHVREDDVRRHFEHIADKGKEYIKKDGKPFHRHTLNAINQYLGRQPVQVVEKVVERGGGRDEGETVKGETKSDEAAEEEAEESRQAAEAQRKAVEEGGGVSGATGVAGKSLLSKIGRLFGKGVGALKGTASGAKAVGGAAVGAGLGAGSAIGQKVGNIVVKTGEDVARSGFWIILTAALWLVDFLFWRFGGIDYNKIIDAIQAGGLAALLRIVLPFYVVIVLVIFLALRAAESRNMGLFLIVVFVPLLIINHFGLNYDIYGISITAISLIISTIIVSLRLELEDRHGFYSWVLLGITGSAIISVGGFFSGIHHLAVATLIWLFLLKTKDEKFTRANYIISVLLIVDFFGFGLWQSFGPLQGNKIIANRFIFPLWFLFTLIYTAGERKSPFAKVVLAATIFFYLIVLVQGYYGWENIQAQVKAHPEEVAEAQRFFQDAFSKLKAFPGKIWEEYEKGMEYATGGYYQGKVEENKDPRNELGVHIGNLQAADKEFYQNEQVVVWGDLKAKTLDEPIYIYISCESGDANGKIVPEKLSNPEYLKDYGKGYIIEKLEQIPFECRLDGNDLKAGINEIRVNAEFNFQTFGYLKTYFIDIERMRALRRDNIDPLRQYGIDKIPEAIYTNGPVRLGMGTTDPPIGLSKTSDGYSFIGVTVQPQWYGKIKNITNIEIQVPKGFDISDPGGKTYCRDDFEIVGEDEEGYSKYNMKKDKIKKIKTPISEYKSWRCSIRIPSGDVPKILGNTPIAVYYYRASVDYIYEIEKSISAYIKSVEGEKRVLSDCETVCDDDDGCVCNNDECGMPKGETIKKGYTCDNYPVGKNRKMTYDRAVSDIDDATQWIAAYLTLNELCAKGLTQEAEKALDESKLDDSEKKEIRGLLEKCSNENTRVNYIEPAEGKIVNKVENVVELFSNVRGKSLTANEKEVISNKENEFINFIDKVRESFKKTKEQLSNIQDEEYNEKLNAAQARLRGIHYKYENK